MNTDTHSNGQRKQDEGQKNQTLMLRPSRLPMLGIGLSVLLAAAAFFSGLQIGSGNEMRAGLGNLLLSDTRPAENVDLSEFWQTWNLLEEKFVHSSTTDALSEQERVHGAIQGLVDSYDDPYSVFLPPEDAEKFAEDISGNFSGVGMEVGIRDGVITVIAPLPDTPAENAGLLSGDAITRIDDVTTEGMSIDEAVRLIRGEKGTEVTLTVFREEEDGLLDIAVVRDTITIPTIDTEMRGDIFIISLYSFNALAEARMQEALREYVQSGASMIVLDLRGNPGGFLQSAVAIASYFLDTGEVVVRENFGDGADDRVYRSSGKTLQGYTPSDMAILVDGGSASASEILAGALREHNVAQLIGTQTFGKGSVQELIGLNGGGSLKVTVARWFTPNGVSISEGGLTPDVEVDRTREQFLADEDPQMDAALEYLRN